MKRSIILALILMFATAVPAKIHRSHSVRRQFQRAHPCPSTGRKTGKCFGFVVDHVIPLCHGGADAIANMQWQTTAAAKMKDRQECK